MNGATFETALNKRVDMMLEACTKCGKCVEACPSVEPAGIKEENSEEVVAGIVQILKDGEGPAYSRTWAQSCVLSGACIKACDYGVNPRFLLAMARARMLKHESDPAARRRDGVINFRTLARDVAVLSQLQLDGEILERLGQGSASASMPEEIPEFVFYTGCNVLTTPHIALLALDIMDRLGVDYHVAGGPSHCCGIMQMRAGDIEVSGRMGSNTIDKLARTKSGQVLSWCPSCYVQFTETTLPVLQEQQGTRPFEMTPFLLFLKARLDSLKPHLHERVELRVALHKHPGVAGVMEAAAEILQVIPGIELIDLRQPAVGLQSVNLRVLPAFKRELQLKELEAAQGAHIHALVTVYHSDYRELCAHERDWPFRIVNILGIVGLSMGLHRHDRYKELKIMQDAGLIVEECRDLLTENGLDPALAHEVVASAMLADQPLPLKGSSHPPKAEQSAR
jgi:Fe-S oxidoreductase